MAGEKTAHRPPSRLAPSPPSKIKAPWRFFTRPGKNPSLCEIPYQSPKKCLKTQITTFSILKFSPKAKNTPVLTVFTLFLPSSSCLCHHPAVCVIILLFVFLKIPRGKNSYRPIIIVYLPANFLTHNHRTDPQRPTYSTFRHSSSFSPLFRDSTGCCQISRFHKLPYPKSHKNDLF